MGRAAAYERQQERSLVLSRSLECERAPDRRRARVMRDVRASGRGADGLPLPSAASWRWMSMAVTIVAVVGGMLLLAPRVRQRGSSDVISEALSGHTRSPRANHLTDVASTDKQTFKPWFNGRLDSSPPVTDFAVAGFPLVGGRLDYLQGRPVAALVYERGRHVINVFVCPAKDMAEAMAPAQTQRGFSIIPPTHAGMACWVTSILTAEELHSPPRHLYISDLSDMSVNSDPVPQSSRRRVIVPRLREISQLY